MGIPSDYPEAIPIWACPKFWTIRLGSDLKRACPNLRQTQIVNCRGYIPWYPHHLAIISPFWLIYVDFTHIHIIVRGIGLITQSIIRWVWMRYKMLVHLFSLLASSERSSPVYPFYLSQLSYTPFCPHDNLPLSFKRYWRYITTWAGFKTSKPLLVD